MNTSGRGTLVDVHAHLLPPGYVEASVAAGHTTPDGILSWPGWSTEQHLRLMDEAGIETAVLSVSSPGVFLGDPARAPSLATAVNDYTAELCAEHPDRFRFFASLPLPTMDAALAELERACDDLGAVGIVLPTQVDGHYPSDPMMTPLWRQLQARGTIVLLHPTSPPGWQESALGLPQPLLEFLVETTRAIIGLVDQGTLAAAPDVDVIVPHCGALLPTILDRWELFTTVRGDGGTVWTRTSATTEAGTTTEAGGMTHSLSRSPEAALGRLWFDLAGTPMPRNAAALIERVGTDRILYGSDYCFTPGPVVRRQIDSLDAGWPDVDEAPWRALTTRNAHALLDSAARSTTPVSTTLVSTKEQQ